MDYRLTDAQIEELRSFLRVHYPGMAKEFDRLAGMGNLREFPHLLDACWCDMKRYQAGEPTRYMSFLDLLPPAV